MAHIVFGDVNPSGKLPFSMVKQWEDFGPVAAQLENPDKLIVWPRDTKYRIVSPLGVGRFKVFGGDPKMLKSKNFGLFENDPVSYDRMDHMVYAEGRYLGYRYLDKAAKKAQFPFGFGLSYTDFKIDQLKVSRSSFSQGEEIKVTVSVTNTGDCAGAEVVQLYVHAVDSKVDRVQKELKGFEKVRLEPGETKSVSMPLTADSFRYYDTEESRWITEPGVYEILIGNSSENLTLVTSVTFR